MVSTGEPWEGSAIRVNIYVEQLTAVSTSPVDTSTAVRQEAYCDRGPVYCSTHPARRVIRDKYGSARVAIALATGRVRHAELSAPKNEAFPRSNNQRQGLLLARQLVRFS